MGGLYPPQAKADLACCLGPGEQQNGMQREGIEALAQGNNTEDVSRAHQELFGRGGACRDWDRCPEAAPQSHHHLPWLHALAAAAAQDLAAPGAWRLGKTWQLERQGEVSRGVGEASGPAVARALSARSAGRTESMGTWLGPSHVSKGTVVPSSPCS